MTPTTPTTTDASIPPAPRRRSAARLITPALALVAAIGIGVVGGVVIGQNTASASDARGSGAQGAFGDAAGDAPAGGGMGGLTAGTVTAVDGSTVTLELDDGSTVTVTTTDDTTVTTSDEATVADLAEGDTLTVVGEADDDGTVEATAITEGATGMGGMRTPPASGTSD
jgi:hypothetical protein